MYQIENILSVVKTSQIIIRNVFSHSDFFKSPVLIKVDDEKIVLTHPSMDYVGLTQKATHRKNGGWTLSSRNKLPDVGYYPLCTEESDEDRLVFYLDEKITDLKDLDKLTNEYDQKNQN